MKYVVAPNCFRGSLTQVEVAREISAGVRKARSNAVIIEAPISDGGDGFLEVCIDCLGLARMVIPSVNAIGHPIEVEYGFDVNHGRIVLEAARITGLELVASEGFSAMSANSYGLGLALRTLLDKGYRKFVVGLGGSAIVDGGAGLVIALGGTLMGEDGRRLSASVHDLVDLCSIDVSELDGRLAESELVLACDTDFCWSAAIEKFGPQKGLNSFEMTIACEAAKRWGVALENLTGRSWSESSFGACNGGVAMAIMALFGGKAIYGGDFICDALDLPAHFDSNTVLITGEGRLDFQSMSGKGPWRIALAAKECGCYVVAVVADVEASIATKIDGVIDKLVVLFPGATAIQSRSETLFSLNHAAFITAESLRL